MGCTGSQEKRPTPAAADNKPKKTIIYEESAPSPVGPMRMVSDRSHSVRSDHAAGVVGAQIHDLDMTVTAFEHHAKPPPEWTTWSAAFAEKYDVKYEVGQGSYASVWKAEMKPAVYEKLAAESKHHVHRHAAVKVVHKEQVGDAYWEQAKAEALVLSALDHPNVVELIEAYENPETLLLVTQLCRGGEVLCSVTEHVQIYSEVACAAILHSVLSGIAYLHDQKLAHRDLKPANLIFKHRLKNLAGAQLRSQRMAVGDSHCSQQISAMLDDGGKKSYHSQSIAIGDEVKVEVCQRAEKEDWPSFSPIGGAKQVSNTHLVRNQTLSQKECKFHVQRQGHHHAKHVKCDDKNEQFLHQLKSAMMTKKGHHHKRVEGKHQKVGMIETDVVICDFGNAIRVPATGFLDTVTGLTCSELFAAPEILSLMVKANMFSNLPGGEGLNKLPQTASGYSEKCDVWSIGIIAYVLLAGVHPVLPQIEESDHCIASIIEGIISWKAPNFDDEAWRKISPEAKDFVARCLEKDQDKRVSAKELLQHAWITSRKARSLQDASTCKNIVFEAAVSAMSQSNVEYPRAHKH